MQTRTRAGIEYEDIPGRYRLTYYMDDYKVMETDLLGGLASMAYVSAVVGLHASCQLVEGRLGR